MEAKEVNAQLIAYYKRVAFSTAEEIALPNRLRFDLLALSHRGMLYGFEIKVSTSDLGRDTKWMRYLEFCDYYYFAVGPAVNKNKVPENAGMIDVTPEGIKVLRPPGRTLCSTTGKAQAMAALARRGIFQHTGLHDTIHR